MPDGEQPDEKPGDAVVVSRPVEEPTGLDKDRLERGMNAQRVVYVEAVEL